MSFADPSPSVTAAGLSGRQPSTRPLFPLDRLRRLLASRPMRALLHIEHRLYAAMARHGLWLTRLALGSIFLWFGILKLLPAVTPIDLLAERTLTLLTFHHVPAPVCLHVLAVWEILIGLGFLTGRCLRLTLALLFLQLPGTFLPLVLLTQETWIHFPLAPSFEGQYIIKNLVLIAAGVVIGSSVRGGRIIADPQVAATAERAELALEERALRKTEASLAEGL